jgi:regulator of sigma E protease
MLKNLFKKLISFNKEQIQQAINQFSWPVGAVKVWQIILENMGIIQYLAFAAMISLALFIFNILPIPALDWWRLLSVIIQTILRLNPEKYFVVENRLNLFMFVLLMALWIYIIHLDLIRFWGL